MKANLAVKLSALAILLFITGLLAGCQTAPPADWNSRVGVYTYDQCVAELGWPTKQDKTSDGKIVDTWVTLRGGGFMGNGSYVGTVDSIGAAQPMMQPRQDHVLQLTFGTDGKLAAVSKNY